MFLYPQRASFQRWAVSIPATLGKDASYPQRASFQRSMFFNRLIIVIVTFLLCMVHVDIHVSQSSTQNAHYRYPASTACSFLKLCILH